MNKTVAVGAILFVAGIIVGRASVLVNQPSSPPPAVTSAPLTPPAQGEQGQVLRGRVAEVIQVSQYTYLRLESGEWAAVPASPSLAVGQSVGVSLQNEMVDFTSPSLGRTFARIWFGALEGAAPQAPQAQQPQPLPSAPPGVQAALQAVGSSNAVSLRVVDVFSERKALVGQRVKVTGTVDRVNFVQGVHYVHMKDGTGVAADKTDDLLVLSQVDVAKGAQVTAEGVVAIDRDVGMGSVAVLLDQAQVR